MYLAMDIRGEFMKKTGYKKRFVLPLLILIQSLLMAEDLQVGDGTAALLKESILPSEQSEYLPEYGSSKEKAAQTLLAYFNSLFSTQYAPLKWKQKRYQLDLDLEQSKALSDLKNIKNWHIDSLKPIFSRLVDSTKDLHVGLLFEDQRIAKIPLEVELVGDKVIVRTSSHESIFPGDEIVTMDGDKPLDHIKRVFYGSKDVNVTRPYFLLERAFTRNGARMSVPQEGDILRIEVRQGTDLNVYEVPWNVNNTNSVASFFDSDDLNYRRVGSNKLLQNRSSFFSNKGHWLARTDIPLCFDRLNRAQTQFLVNSYNKTYGSNFTEDTDFLWDPLDWEIFDQEGVSVGYMRVEDFESINFDQVDEALRALQKKTEALVLDLRGNPGGYDFSCFGLAGRLIAQPLVNLMNSLILDESIIEDFREVLSELQFVLDSAETDDEIQDLLGGLECSGLPMTLDFARALVREARFCIEEWDSGYTCSRFEPLRGMDKIYPHPTIRYTKPLYILIDEKCASCADIFPALMKDNNRATLLGRTTSGGGGVVEEVPITSVFGIKSLSLTRSLMLRNNRMVIEDVGISPHFEHKKTVESVIDPNQEKMKAIDFAAKDVLSKKNK